MHYSEHLRAKKQTKKTNNQEHASYIIYCILVVIYLHIFNNRHIQSVYFIISWNLYRIDFFQSNQAPILVPKHYAMFYIFLLEPSRKIHPMIECKFRLKEKYNIQLTIFFCGSMIAFAYKHLRLYHLNTVVHQCIY